LQVEEVVLALEKLADEVRYRTGTADVKFSAPGFDLAI
jgi:hypothetical protein